MKSIYVISFCSILLFITACGSNSTVQVTETPKLSIEYDYQITLALSNIQDKKKLSFIIKQPNSVLEGNLVLIKDSEGNLYEPVPLGSIKLTLSELGRWQLNGTNDGNNESFEILAVEFPKNKFVSFALSSIPLGEILNSKLNLPKAILSGAKELVTCGPSHVTIYKVNDEPRIEPEIIWSWLPENNDVLPGNIAKYFSKIDECKPYANGEIILITSSSGGIGILERSTGNLLFFGYSEQVHSAEIVSNNKIVIAIATHLTYGDKLLLVDFFDTTTTPEHKVILNSAHGIYWDENMQEIWALGRTELNLYQIIQADSKDTLTKISSKSLPSGGGHELFPVWSDKNSLYVTSSSQILLFDTSENIFKEHSELISHKKIKGISNYQNRIAFVQADDGVWWSTCVNLTNPTQKICTNDRLYYKTRWITKLNPP